MASDVWKYRYTPDGENYQVYAVTPDGTEYEVCKTHARVLAESIIRHSDENRQKRIEVATSILSAMIGKEIDLGRTVKLSSEVRTEGMVQWSLMAYAWADIVMDQATQTRQKYEPVMDLRPSAEEALAEHLAVK